MTNTAKEYYSLVEIKMRWPCIHLRPPLSPRSTANTSRPLRSYAQEQLNSYRWIARIFRVSTSFIVRLLQRRRTAGPLPPEPHRGGPPPALEPGDLERLAGVGP